MNPGASVGRPCQVARARVNRLGTEHLLLESADLSDH